MAKSIAKNTGYLYAKVLINAFISLYTTRLILNSLGTVDFGLWGVVGGVISLLSFINPALSAATQRFLSFYEGKNDVDMQRRIFSASIVIHFFMAILLVILLEFAAYPVFNGILNIPVDRIHAAEFVYQCMVLSLFFTFISVPYDATINAHEDMKYYALVGIFESFLKLVAALIISLELVALKLETYGVCHVIITVVVLLTMRSYSKRNYQENKFSIKYIDKSTVKTMCSFAFWNLTGTFSNIVGNYGSSVVTNHFFGTKINAVLSIIGQLGSYLITFSSNMMKAVNPAIVKKAGSGDDALMLTYSVRSCKMAFLLFSFFAVPVLVETPYVLELWLGQVPEWAVLFVRIYFIRVFFEQITVSLKTTINAKGRIAKMNFSTFVSQLFSLPVMYLAFDNSCPVYSGLIVSMIFMAIIPGFIQLYYAKKLCGLSLRVYAKEVLCRALPCTLVSFVACVLFHWNFEFANMVEFLFILLIHISLFFFLVYLIGIDKSEREYLRGFMSSFFRKYM